MPGIPSYRRIGIGVAAANSVTEGGESKILTSDADVQQLLLNILFELRKINLHLALMNGTEINDSDIMEG